MQTPGHQTSTIDVEALVGSSRLRPVQVTTFVLCGLVALLDGADTQSFAIAAPSIAATFGMKVAEFGLAFSIAHLGACLGALVCGPLSDSIGRKPVLVGATLVFALFTITTAVAGSYHALLAIRFCAGLGLGGAVPCFLALASDFAPTGRRGTLASLLWAAYPLGGAAGGFANSALVANYGWPMMFYVGGGIPLLLAAAMAAALPESPVFLAARDSTSPKLRAIAERIAGRRLDEATGFSATGRKLVKRPVRDLFAGGRLPVTLALWVAFFGAFGMLALTVSWTPALLQGAGVSPAASATVLGFYNLGAVIGMGAAGRLVDRFGAGATLVPALGIAAVAMWLLGLVNTATEASATLVLLGLSLGCGASGLIAVASVFYETGTRGTGLGWGMALGRSGQVVGPLLVGMLLVHGFVVGPVLQALAIVPVIIAAAVLLARTTALRGLVANADRVSRLPG